MRILALAGAVLAGACGIGSRPPPAAPPPSAALDQLVAAAGAATLVPQALPADVAADDPTGGAPALVIASTGWRPPAATLPEPTVEALRRFVERGGRLLLLGYATALAHELGIEPQVPEQSPFRWGFDARTSRGRARLGFLVTSGAADELFDGMQHAQGGEHVYFLAGGEPCSVARCAFTARAPERGQVLAQLACERDGAPATEDAAVLVRWTLGRGAVLALGLEPQAESGDTAVAQNARVFVQHAVRWLLGTLPVRTLPCWMLPEPLPAPLPRALPPAAVREVPGAPLLAHWGWLAAPQDGSVACSVGQLVDDVLVRSWQSGADLLQFGLVQDERCVLPWDERDPLRRPGSFRGGALPGWHQESVSVLATEAHVRGMLVHGVLDPLPVGELPVERLAALRFLARELADRRRLGSGALDGYAVRDWFADGEALGPAMLQDFEPTARLLRLGETEQAAGGALRALDAADGQPCGLCAYGLSAAFRAGFPGDLFPLGYLDATARRPLRGPGGGSGGDWIATQAADFVRERRDRGGALLWRAHAQSTLASDTEAYVHGVSMEPLVAAVAARCTTIGEGGWRDAQRALQPEIQAGFGPELAVPADTVLLANNHLRLCGSGGTLLFDPTGLAEFHGSAPIVLAREFLRTRLSGGRPAPESLRIVDLDLLAAGRRPFGGYERVHRVEGGAEPPAQLAFGAGDRWPQRVEFPLDVGIGYFELQLELRATAGQGVVAVGVDDSARVCLPFQEGRLSVRRSLPLHLATGGHRTLWLEVQDGGTVAIDKLGLERTGDVAVEAEVAVPAGSYAAVRERSASSHHQETVELCTIADFPGFLLRSECGRAMRNLQLERVFGLARHRTLRACAVGEGPAGLRQPFALAADDESLPDLVVVPQVLGRYERFVLRDGALVLQCQPEPGAASRIGFCLVPRADSERALARLGTVFDQLDRPTKLDLGRRGRAELCSEPDFAWPRLLQVERRVRTPFLVCEHGWWTWRPTQTLPDGSELLRVWQLPGDTVQLRSGQELLASTRPGPGSLRRVALRDPEPASVTVRVLQASGLAPPSVVLGADFDTVFVDGRAWSYHDERTVWLPDRAAVFSVVARRQNGAPQPHVIACSTPLEECTYDAGARELSLTAGADATRPFALPCMALLAGPPPTRIDGGELVADDELRHATAAERAQAAAKGVAIRFRAGRVRVHYGD